MSLFCTGLCKSQPFHIFFSRITHVVIIAKTLVTGAILIQEYSQVRFAKKTLISVAPSSKSFLNEKTTEEMFTFGRESWYFSTLSTHEIIAKKSIFSSSAGYILKPGLISFGLSVAVADALCYQVINCTKQKHVQVEETGLLGGKCFPSENEII